MSIQAILSDLHQKYQIYTDGQCATYIPELAKANTNHFGLAVATVDGELFSCGDDDVTFTLQSASKPFTYGLALQNLGREFVHSKVGVEPSGEAFNSIVELEKSTHRPYNPMINSGAIAISSMIRAKSFGERQGKFMEMFENYSGRTLGIDEGVFASEKKTAHRNRSIAHLLRHFNIIGDDIDETLDLYFKHCSVLADVKDLAVMAATLANKGVNPRTKRSAVPGQHVADILSLMFTCGMYDSSGEWAYTVGLPAKSGVSGCIFGVVPGSMGIAVFSPPIDGKGHSVRGQKVFQELSKTLGLGIFK
jgi:glutaminase